MTFDKLTKRNAKAFFELYMAGKDGAIEALKQLSAATGGPKASELDFSHRSVTPLWKWVRALALSGGDKLPPADNYPIWYAYEVLGNDHYATRFTPPLAAFVDKLAFYWGETAIHNIPDLQWGIGPYRNDFTYCKPVVLSEFYTKNPLRSMINLVGIASDQHHEANTDDLLEKMLNHSIDEEQDYRQKFNANNRQHDDPRVKNKVIFD